MDTSDPWRKRANTPMSPAALRQRAPTISVITLFYSKVAYLGAAARSAVFGDWAAFLDTNETSRPEKFARRLAATLLRCSWFAVGFALFGSFVSVSNVYAGACNLYSSGDATPAGFGVPWNTLSSSRELLITASCDGGNATIIVGSGSPSQYVYRYGFRWTGSSWSRIDLSGAKIVADTWYVGEAFADVQGTEDQGKFIVAYVCQWTGTQWKCGCRDSACATNHWQLQGVTYPKDDGDRTADGKIPHDACWYYAGANSSASFIQKYNSALDGPPTLGSDHLYVPIDGQPGDYIYWWMGQSKCPMLSDGRLSCVRKSGDANSHAMFAVSSENCGFVKNSEKRNYTHAGIPQGALYRFGADVCAGPELNRWLDDGGRSIVSQFHGEQGGRSPPFALRLKDGQWDVYLEGTVFKLMDIAIPSAGRCWNFEVLFRYGANGIAGVWIDGKRYLYKEQSIWADVDSLRAPDWGVYTGDENLYGHAPQLIFDNLWARKE